MLFSSDSPTSSASIVVDPTGHNFCVVNFGATKDLTPSDVENSVEAIKSSKILVTTRMIQEASALKALKFGREHNCINIFNFAPATSDLNDEFNAFVDLLIVNEVEVITFFLNLIAFELQSFKQQQKLGRSIYWL